MNCPEAIDLMEDVLEGRLAPSVRPGFEEHMDECDACRTYLDQLTLTIRALERLPRGDETSPRRSELIDAFRREFEKPN